MSHGLQGEGWGIMWDNCWIALASENQNGGEKGEEEDDEELEEENKRVMKSISVLTRTISPAPTATPLPPPA